MATPDTKTPDQQPAQTPPAGWYANPEGAGQRYWDGARWIEQHPSSPAQAGKIHDAYVANARIRGAGIIARLCAAFLFAGFVGSLATWGKQNSIFEMASTNTETYRPGPGYVVGPALILLLLPLVRKINPGFAYKRLYRARVVIAALLFATGLAVLAVNLTQLDPGYTTKAGTYIAAALLTVGMVAATTMWPAGLASVRVDRAGRVEGAAPGTPPPAAPVMHAAATPQAPPVAQPPPAQAPQMQPPPGWYANPGGPGQRYWDGSRWTEQYSQAPAVPPAKTRRATLWIVGLVTAVLVGIVAVAALHDLFLAKDHNDAGQKAVKAANRLDNAMTNTFNRTDPVVGVAFSCLATASNINPYGGPRLARCVPVAERAARRLRQARARLAPVYRSSPSYVRRIYGPAYAGTQRVLGVHAAYVDAMAQWARVHGASSFQGRAEFDVIRTARARVIAADRRYDRLMDRARRNWKRYAERRWDVKYK